MRGVLWMACLACLAVLGCDDGGSIAAADSGSTDARFEDAQPDVEAADDGVDVRACNGRYVLSSVTRGPDTCLAAPPPGAAVLVVNDRLLVAGLDLAITAADDVCALEATGCVADPTEGDRTAHTVRFDTRSGALSIETERAEGFAPVDCAPLEATARPADDECEFSGRYVATMPLALTAGQCDLTWDADTVFIDAESAEGTLRWGSNEFTITATDPDECTLVAESAFFIFNGTVRTVRIEGQLDGRSMTVVVTDGLDGTSDFGETCVDARFEGSAQRADAEAAPLVAECAPLPYVCGDGVCAAEAGESCGTCAADCGCDTGQCLRFRPNGVDEPQYTCSTACNGVPCPDGQRCVPAQEFEASFTGGDFSLRVCLEADGDTGLGGDCTDSRACGPGLMCARNIQPGGRCLPDCTTVDRNDCRECWPITANNGLGVVELCRPTCGPGVESACGDSDCASFPLNRVCSTDDRETYFCQPTELIYECRADAPGFGEPCTTGQWCGGVGLLNGDRADAGCIEAPCTRGDDGFECTGSVCSRPCQTDDDCAAPLPRCSIVETPRGPSRWCRAL